VFFVQALIVAQAPSCYYPESPRVCQVVNAPDPVAQPAPNVPAVTAVQPNPSGAGFGSLAPLMGLPLLGVPFAGFGKGGTTFASGTSSDTPQTGSPDRAPVSAPVPMALPGMLVGAGLLWAARRNRVSLAALPLFLVPITGTPAIAPKPGPQAMVFPLISGNMMTVNYGGQNIALATPLGMPQDTTKYRYYAQSTENGWQICWEEIKPEICPPKATPKRVLW
jgi:hypothetical protein